MLFCVVVKYFHLPIFYADISIFNKLIKIKFTEKRKAINSWIKMKKKTKNYNKRLPERKSINNEVMLRYINDLAMNKKQ